MSNFNHIHFRSNSKKHKEPKLSNFKKIIIGIIFLLIFNYGYFGFLVSPSDDIKNSISINIPAGTSLKEIAKILKKENLINSKFLFLSYVKSQDQETKIQSGFFRIPVPQNIPSLTNILITGPISEDRITIPEGYKISQIDQLLSEKGLIETGDFIDCVRNCEFQNEILKEIQSGNPRNLEGFLFPDTYFVNTASFSSQELITKMLSNFESKLPSDWQEKAANLPQTSLYDVINMASIIEREVLSKKDKQKVSGILWKRIQNGWTLGADATLLYLKEDNDITDKDLLSSSPYNTRKQLGLPPTPISNPGLSSIEAALNPIATEYWFYITTLDTGQVIYAKTNEEHNANVDEYLR